MLYYESNNEQDKAFTICAHYKHGFIFKTPARKFVEVTHPSDESISILFESASCSDVHELAEPIGFSSEQEYIDLISTAGTWLKELAGADATANSLELNIGYDETTDNFTKLTNPSGIEEFYIPGLQENLFINRAIGDGAYKIENIGINDTEPQAVVTETDSSIAKVCILRAKSGWKHALNNIQIKMIKSEISFSNQFALCESMGARLPYLSDFNQVSVIHAFVDSQLDEYETFSVMKSNYLFSKDTNVMEYDIRQPIGVLGEIGNVNVEKKSNDSNGDPIIQSSVMCVKNGAPYIDFSFGKETVTEESEIFTPPDQFDPDANFEWNELHSVKRTGHLFELDRQKYTSYERPRFTVDHLRNYCESIDSYPVCWNFTTESAQTNCPYLTKMPSTDILFPEPLPKEEQKCSKDELIYSQENGKINRLRLERRQLTLEKAKQRCNSFGMDIYTPYSISEARQLLKMFREKNSWLQSTSKLLFWTNLERTNDDPPEISSNDVISKDWLGKLKEEESICFRNKKDHTTGVLGKTQCGNGDDQTRHHFMCVERIKDGYKQQRKVVINYEHNAKEVIIDFVPSVHAIRLRKNSLLNNTVASWNERAKPENESGSAHYKIPFSFIGMAPWDGTKLSNRYFESK